MASKNLSRIHGKGSISSSDDEGTSDVENSLTELKIDDLQTESDSDDDAQAEPAPKVLYRAIHFYEEYFSQDELDLSVERAQYLIGKDIYSLHAKEMAEMMKYNHSEKNSDDEAIERSDDFQSFIDRLHLSTNEFVQGNHRYRPLPNLMQIYWGRFDSFLNALIDSTGKDTSSKFLRKRCVNEARQQCAHPFGRNMFISTCENVEGAILSASGWYNPAKLSPRKQTGNVGLILKLEIPVQEFEQMQANQRVFVKATMSARDTPHATHLSNQTTRDEVAFSSYIPGEYVTRVAVLRIISADDYNVISPVTFVRKYLKNVSDSLNVRCEL